VAATRPEASADVPLLRGWLHTGAAFAWLLASIPLLARAERLGGLGVCAVFVAAMEVVFVSSAILHRVPFSPQGRQRMRRVDHAAILVGIAGTGTAVVGLCLSGTARTAMLSILWLGALGGIVVRQWFLDGPAWAYAVPYLALGWCALLVAPPLFHALGAWGSAWLVLGGLSYTAGALCLGLRRPNPLPRHFGYHELFHLATLLGVGAHWIVISFFALPYAAR
jgi:hemolysin III